MRLEVEKILPSFKALSHEEDGKVILIDGALEAEVVEAELIAKKKDYDEARVKKVLKASRERKEPGCPFFGLCGSCKLLYMTEREELRLKESWVKEIFNRKDFPSLEFLESEDCKREESRLRAIFKIKDGKIGYFKSFSNEVVEIENCFLLESNLNLKLSLLRENLSEIKGSEIKKLSFNREISSNSGFINISNFSYFASTDCFFQANRQISSSMLDFVLSEAKGLKNVLDLYAGVGFFSKALEESFKDMNIVAVEENDSSFQASKKNLKRTRFLNISVENSLFTLSSKEYDLAIIDPIRSGMSLKALDVISKLNIKKILYFSCQAEKSVKDIKYLCQHCSFVAKRVKLFNMNPATEHFETVCVLEHI